jgi:hypothetical protein
MVEYCSLDCDKHAFSATIRGLLYTRTKIGKITRMMTTKPTWMRLAIYI